MKNIKIIYLIILLVFSWAINSCSEFLEVETPKDLMDQQVVFNDDVTAVSAVTNIYTLLRNSGFLCGNNTGVGVLMGAYADELQVTASGITDQMWFYQLNVLSSNASVKRLWDTSYQQLYQINSAIEGLESSTNLSVNVKEQLLGECYFLRALLLSYLNNTFGEIPYVTSTDYQINKSIGKTSQSQINKMLVVDLENAISLLDDAYPSQLRTRVNKSAANLLLARVYLYQGEWNKAFEAAEITINNPIYVLEELDKVFYAESTSTVLSLRTLNDAASTFESQIYFFETLPPPNVALANNFIDVFPNGDLRKSLWVSEVSNSNETFYRASKYKRRTAAQPLEFSVILRIEEAYLIAAEASVRIGNFDDAELYFNTIHTRVGLNAFSSSDTQTWLEMILQERKREFFTEFAHRFYDLKRLNKLHVLSETKPNWQTYFDKLPLPEAELQLNPNLQPQNVGY